MHEPGRKDDKGKLRYSLIPPDALAWIARVLTDGAAKYGAHNWRKVRNRRERYTDAMIRHVEAFRSGNWLDESGAPHLAHVATNAIFLLAIGQPRKKDNSGRK